MEKDLGVYIPTYHRAEVLKKCLNSIIAECKRCNYQDLDIYVSNNDRYDVKTKEVVAELQEEYPIIYEENEHNLGPDGNMRKAFELKGIHHCLMLGDDDELKRGAFDILFDIIKEDVAFAILNWATIYPGYYICNYWGGGKREWENKIYKDAIECFKENYNKMPYGTILVNLKYVTLVDERERNRFMGTFHLYSGILWDMALKHNRILRTAEPVVVKREKAKKYYESYQKDVNIRAIPEWYDKLAEPYQEWAQAAKMLWVLECYNSADDAMKIEILEKFPLIKILK